MADKDETPVPKIIRDENGTFVHYGFEHDGAFHPFATERTGDYDERVEAAKENEE